MTQGAVVLQYEFSNWQSAFAIQSNMSRQRLLAHRRSAATGTSLCITIRFVQTVAKLVGKAG